MSHKPSPWNSSITAEQCLCACGEYSTLIVSNGVQWRTVFIPSFLGPLCGHPHILAFQSAGNIMYMTSLPTWDRVDQVISITVNCGVDWPSLSSVCWCVSLGIVLLQSHSYSCFRQSVWHQQQPLKPVLLVVCLQRYSFINPILDIVQYWMHWTAVGSWQLTAEITADNCCLVYWLFNLQQIFDS